jgi:hypothetical protein
MTDATQLMRRRRASVDLTDAQAAAVLSALDYFLTAGTAEEAEQVFGSASGTAAAGRAADKLTRAFYGSET